MTLSKEILDLFEEVLKIDSTSGRERALAEFLMERLEAPVMEAFEVGDGTLNLLLQWGKPKVVFCSHLDTVPPYIPPVFGHDGVAGRGACDAKGQWIAMYAACKELERRGQDSFALLLVSGEEIGSVGAKAFSGSLKAPLLVIGEPTDNIPVSAAKGTKSYDLRFVGEPFHSGYPDKGRSAVEMFMDFMIGLEIEAESSRRDHMERGYATERQSEEYPLSGTDLPAVFPHHLRQRQTGPEVDGKAQAWH